MAAKFPAASCRQPIFCCASLTQASIRAKDADPVLEAWAREQILKSAKGAVHDQGAYLFVARKNFFDHLPDKVEAYLTDALDSYIAQCIHDAPRLGVGFYELNNYLEWLCAAHHLPIDSADTEITSRIFDAVIRRNQGNLQVFEPCGLFPTEKYLNYRCGIGTVDVWHAYRTSICEPRMPPPCETDVHTTITPE
jgi:hypothetical protein